MWRLPLLAAALLMQAASVHAAGPATDVLQNGDFEAAEGDRPAFWQTEAAPGVTARWEEQGGIDGSRCISLSATEPVNAVWDQSLQLAPYTAYLLKGYIRGAGLHAEGKYPASLGVTMWKAENGPKKETESLEWTPFEVDFATDPSGKVDVLCKLGVYGDKSAGTVYFDNLTLERNPDVETFESRNFVLHLYRDEIALATRPAVEQMMANIDRVCDAYSELTGYAPQTERQSAWAPDKWSIDALGWSGNPVLWTGDRKWIGENWPREGYCPEVFLHELAHNWDSSRWTFHGHFCELKMAYALETLNLGIAEDGWTRGKDTRHRWEFRTRRNRGLGICDELVQTYRNLQIVDQVGWEPFKKTYRYFLALPEDQVPPDAWSKFRLWHDKVTEFSGFDTWSVYTPGEIEYAKAYYTPHPDPASLPALAQIAEDVREVSLTEVKWESAKVGWEEPKYGLYGSGDKWYPQAIYAHAPSSYVYPLAGKWKTYTASCGLERGSPGSVVFVVKGDGKELFRSETVKDFAERPVQGDVTGVQSLELVVEDAGDGKNSDHGVWFSPKLTR
jgi:hypothetical protein